MSQQKYQFCIDACIECATECNHCAVSCLEEKDVQSLTKCIRLNLECAIICRVTAELMSLGSRYSKEICQLCATICTACAEECEKHAGDGLEYCRECAEICRTSAKETLEIYQILLEQSSETKEADKPSIQQDECSVISRATAELISLGSAYGKEISKLNATVCNAYAEEFNMHLNMGMKDCKECAKVATDAHLELESQEQKSNAIMQNGTDKAGKKKNSYSAALLKAYMLGSAVSHVRRHAYKDGNFANIGTNISYREDQ